MVKILKYVALASIALIYGCASTPPMEQMKSEVAGYTLPKQAVADKGLVYVVRPSNAGTLVRFNVFLDDHEDASEMGYNRGNEYIYFYVAPGKHTLSSKAENWADLQIDVAPGQVVFVRQDVTMGLLMARNDLVLLTDTEGRYLVKEASLGTISKEQK